MKRGKASSQPPQTNNTSTVRTQVSRSEPNVALNHASDEEVQPADFDTSKASPTPSTSPVHAPVSPRDGETTAERIKAALEPLKEDKETPPYRPLKKNTHSDSLSGTSSKSKREPVKASDIEYQAADADETESSEKGKSNTSNYSSSSGKQDVDPPKQRKSLKRKEGGAEPGAGENFWQWFQETKGSEAGSSSKNLDCSADTLRLCQMFYKYLRKYKIRTVFDASCATNLNWLPAVLSKAGNELWGFKYYCSATDNEKMENSKQKLSKLSFIEYIGDEWWRDGFPEDTELLFAWDILPHVAYGRVWNFFVKAKKQDIKYILVDNYPGILNDPVSESSFNFEITMKVSETNDICVIVAKAQLFEHSKASISVSICKGSCAECHRAWGDVEKTTSILRRLNVARQSSINIEGT